MGELSVGAEDKVALLTRELKEAREQQAATATVLKAISGSDFDLQSVLDTLVESAARLCDAFDAVITLRQGDTLHFKAHYGPIPIGLKTWRVSRNWTAGRAVVDRVPVHVHDLTAAGEEFPEGRDMALRMGHRTILSVPLLRGDEAIGSLTIRRTEVRPFTDRQVELVRTFADQAVIAIENIRLFEEIEARNRDLSDALQQQTATADVLKVISQSAFDFQPVLDTLVESAARLCEAYDSEIFLKDGDTLLMRAHHGPIPIGFKAGPVSRGWTAGRAVVDRAPVQVDDLTAAGDEFPDGHKMARRMRSGIRTILSVPLLRGDEAIGSLTIRRTEVRPFTDRQIELVQTFADQAVIAIENVRLFEEVQARTAELSEALQQQTATADVLKAISRSTFNLPTVLDSLVQAAARLCDADHAWLFRREGEVYRWAASYGHCEADHETIKQFFMRQEIPPSRGTLIGRTALEGRPVHIPDALADPEYRWNEAQKIGKYRTTFGTPLLREGAPIGVLALTREEARPFTDRQIELATTFADQAVIAIENARLFDEIQTRNREVTQALEKQKATSEILRAISTSPTNAQPVFETIVRNAVSLCDSLFANVFRFDGELLHFVTSHNVGPSYLQALQTKYPMRPNMSQVSGRVILTKSMVRLEDARADPHYDQSFLELWAWRRMLGVPMLRRGNPLGVIVVGWAEAGPIPPAQEELLKQFADQAVIAIENTRLFEEVQAKTQDLEEALAFQRGTGDVLEAIGRSASSLKPVLDAIVETAADLCRAEVAAIRLVKDGALHRAASSGRNDGTLARYVQQRPMLAMDRSTVSGRVALEGRTVHIHNIAADAEYTFFDSFAQDESVGSALGVPLLQDGKVIGAIVLMRWTVDPFTDRQIALVETFADQAVIAIENVRLFQEVQTRTEELSRSLEELKTAQDRLIQTEKLASLGQLTAGIAHEIKNPLNFVNNFSALSVELVDELLQMLRDAAIDGSARVEVEELAGMLKDNLDKIVQHGKRADSIVKNMLLHSRQGSGEHRPADINAIVEESLNLAYHGARAESQGFNITLDTSLDPAAGEVDLYPQEITRVLLNLISNGFYATTRRAAAESGNCYEPTLCAVTKSLGDRVEIRIRDNGIGIPPEVRDKMFNPFFTTKPAGEGTGLGLSLSHDIVVKQHAGMLEVDSEPGRFTEFRIVLPRSAATIAKSGGNA